MNETDKRDGVPLKELVTRHAAPADLRRSIALALDGMDAPPAVTRAWRWPRLGLGFALGVLVGVLTMLAMNFRDRDGMVDEVVAAHVRSMMVAHLEDVASTDRHTVKPWFAGKLDFSPPVADFAAQGFPLSGGRLDYINHQSAAALVYRRRGHVINVFVWPGGSERETSAQRAGYNLVARSGKGMQYWIVSDLNVEELRQFADMLAAAP